MEEEKQQQQQQQQQQLEQKLPTALVVEKKNKLQGGTLHCNLNRNILQQN